jgi:hypothetical protein
MNTGVLIAIVVVLVVIAVAAVLLAQRRRTDRLQQQFGPEYQRTVSRAGDRRAAESELAARTQRRQEMTILTLEPDSFRIVNVEEKLPDPELPLDEQPPKLSIAEAAAEEGGLD